MKIQICSDLHLEFSESRSWLKENPLYPKAEILIIAGDTYYLNRDYTELDFIQKISKDFKQVYLIPGNHEYYEQYDAQTSMFPLKIDVCENVQILNNTAVEIDGVKLIFSTFWSLIQENIIGVQKGLMDFHLIKYNNARLTINQYNELHNRAFDFVSKEVKTDLKKVVISHHLPSEQCNALEFRKSNLNEAFCVDKTDFILNHDIDYWIYGHSHRNLRDFAIGNTQMVTNQFGYIVYDEQRYFDYGKVIEI